MIGLYKYIHVSYSFVGFEILERVIMTNAEVWRQLDVSEKNIAFMFRVGEYERSLP
jgi:hypothetical protein